MMSRRNKKPVQTGTKTAESTQQPIIVQQLTVRPYNRQSQDLTNWRNATRAAESQIPRRVTLYDLYHDVSTTDAQIIAVWGKRVDAVTSADWVFTDKDGNPVDEINQIIDCIGFDELLTVIMKSKSWGNSMAEPTFFVNDNGQNEFSLYEIPEKHMRPELGVIAFEQISNEGINIREGIYAKTIMEFGKPKDLGLLLSAAMYAILKRGTTSDWAEFIEIFGRGIIDATWDGFDENQRAELAKTFEEMGGGGVIIRPDGTNVEIHQNTGNASGDLQDSFVTKMDGYINKVLLGTTETTESSKTSGYAQAKVHQQSDNKKHETDLNFVRRNLNSRFIKVLKAAGFDTKGGTFVLKSKTGLSLKDEFDLHYKMANDLKIPYDDDFFYEKYGMPRPKNYEALKKAIDNSKNGVLAADISNQNADTPTSSDRNNDKPGKLRTQQPGNSKEELSINPGFWKSVLRLFRPAPAVMTGAITCPCGETHIQLASFKSKDFDASAFAKAVDKAQGKSYLYAELFYHNAETLLQGFESGWEQVADQMVRLTSIGFDYGITNPKMHTAWELNLLRFSAGKAAYQSAEVNEIYRNSKSFDDFYRTLKKKFSTYENGVLISPDKEHLQTEWNTANAVGESAATYFRLLEQTETFKYWRYLTIGDQRVRPEHRLLHGLVFAWNDPIWDEIFPPNGWGCRCYIVPVLENEVTDKELEESQLMAKSFFESEEWAKSKKSGFGINRANTKEVFNDSQQYSSTPEKVLKNVGQMYYDDWGMKPIKERQAAATGVFEPAENRDIIQDFYRQHKVSTRKMLLEDYMGREITFEKNRLYGHTAENDKYGERYKYLPGLDQTLKKPDEVWVNDDGSQFDSYVYLKYYKNAIIKVIAELAEDGNLQIKTWYNVSLNEISSSNKMLNDLYRHRRGLPVKN
ncbi:DUF935 family protein [Pedobacter sp. PAMC26386]|nr:DUF935 family protein [Pedobacter sp. PAMC26386]